MATRINFIDLYSFYNDLDATVIETLMEDYNISCSVRTFGSTRSFDSQGFGEKRISVEEDKVENARKIIADAIRSGVISKEAGSGYSALDEFPPFQRKTLTRRRDEGFPQHYQDKDGREDRGSQYHQPGRSGHI